MLARNSRSKKRLILIIGDGLGYLLATLGGFATHGELTPFAWDRFLPAFIPFFCAWLAVAGMARLLDPGEAANPRRLWRPFLGAVLAAPLGAVGRGLWLGTAVVPLFVVIMAGATGLMLLIWRGIYALAARSPDLRL